MRSNYGGAAVSQMKHLLSKPTAHRPFRTMGEEIIEQSGCLIVYLDDQPDPAVSYPAVLHVDGSANYGFVDPRWNPKVIEQIVA